MLICKTVFINSGFYTNRLKFYYTRVFLTELSITGIFCVSSKRIINAQQFIVTSNKRILTKNNAQQTVEETEVLKNFQLCWKYKGYKPKIIPRYAKILHLFILIEVYGRHFLLKRCACTKSTSCFQSNILCSYF